VISSEVSDKEIMESTMVGRQPATGRMQFSFTLPQSGREIKSEWFQESAKTQGVLRWCELVNQAIREDREEERARQKRLAAERAAANVPSVVAPSGAAFQGLTPGMIPTPSPMSAAPGLSSDPRAYVHSQLEQARMDVRHWAGQAAGARENHLRAEEALKQWTAVAQSLGLTLSTAEATSTGGVDRIDFSEEDNAAICGTTSSSSQSLP